MHTIRWLFQEWFQELLRELQGFGFSQTLPFLNLGSAV